MHWSRCFQFKLRTLVAVVTVIAVLLGLVATTVGPYLSEYRNEQRAMTTLGLLDTTEFGTVSFTSKYVGPAWLHEVCGKRYFSRVNVASIHHDLTDEDIRQLQAFSHMHRLDLAYTELTDAGLMRIKELRQVEIEIVLEGSNVSDEAIADLERARPDLIIRR